MRSASPATKAPKLPKALPSVPTRAGTSRAVRPKCSSVPPPLAPSTPRPCASSTASRAPCRRAGAGERGQRREVAVHAEDAVRQHERRPWRARGERRFERGGVAVRIPGEFRARDPPGVDQRGVVERVAEDEAALRHERGREPEVRHVAGREEQRALAPGERGERLLERVVLRAGGRVTRCEARAPTPCSRAASISAVVTRGCAARPR